MANKENCLPSYEVGRENKYTPIFVNDVKIVGNANATINTPISFGG